VESGFLPADAYLAFRKAMPGCAIVDALVVLERLRARKTPGELRLLREAQSRLHVPFD
jgi:Xaa-Pro aminopeptidase